MVTYNNNDNNNSNHGALVDVLAITHQECVYICIDKYIFIHM